MRQWCCYLFLFWVFPVAAQQDACVEIDKRVATVVIDSIPSTLYSFSSVDKPLQVSFVVAYAYFPELASTRIKFKYTKIKTTTNVRPTFTSVIFNSKHNRKYIIRINNSEKDSVIVPKMVPYVALVGLFAHELSHIVDYRERNVFGILGRLKSYLGETGKSKYEKQIDSMVIRRGLGCALYQWSNYVINVSNATNKYKQFKKRIYLKPSEIEQLLKK